MILKGKEDVVCYQWIRSAKEQYLEYRQFFGLGYKVRSKLASKLLMVGGNDRVLVSSTSNGFILVLLYRASKYLSSDCPGRYHSGTRRTESVSRKEIRQVQ
jgi:hypothetical protein